MHKPATDQPPLFDVDTPPVRTPQTKGKDLTKPVWSRYRPKFPVRCDDCITVLVESKGDAPASRQARFRRKAQKFDLLLCYAHAQQRRSDDNLPPLKGVEGPLR